MLKRPTRVRFDRSMILPELSRFMIVTFDSLCDELMLMTEQIVAAIVEHRDGYRVWKE